MPLIKIWKIYNNNLKLIAKAILTLAISLFVLSCSQKKQTDLNTNLKDYAVLALTPQKVTSFNDFPATITGVNTIEIRPMVNGYLENIFVKEGASVKKGQLLFKIKNPQFEQDVISAKAALNSAYANANTAKINVEKVKPLVEKNIVSHYELELAQNNLETSKAMLEQANATLQNAYTNLSYTYIKSPKDGVISSIPYRIGALVSSNSAEPLTILSDISKVEVYFSWNEKQLMEFSSATEGKTLQEKLKQLPPAILVLADGSIYNEKGEIEPASGLINPETGSATLKAVFANPMGLLRSGSSASVRIPTNNNSALIIPQNATYEIQDKRFVYTVTPQNMVISKSFISEPTSDGKFFIAKSGLKEGEKIVLNGFNLKDSTTIVPKLIKSDSIYNSLSNHLKQ